MEEVSVRESVMYLKGFNGCMEELVRNVENKIFKVYLFMFVVFPLRKIINEWDEWHDDEMKCAKERRENEKKNN